ncbi:MAG TPA: hypothetical protein VLJ14_02665 [Ktedonobacterales bacterium]|nr:hypothetical protein [Ktedonobacterales bacterium]
MPNSVLDSEDDEGMEPAAGPAGVDEARDGGCEMRDAMIWLNLAGAATTSPHRFNAATRDWRRDC